MSLKARIQPYIFAFGLIFSLFSFSVCFASPAGMGIEPVITQFGSDFYAVSSLIPLEVFSSSDCGYIGGNYQIRARIFDSTDTDTGLTTFSTGKTQGELNAAGGLQIDYLYYLKLSDYPASGTYYYQFFPYLAGQTFSCGSPAGYAYYPFIVNKEEGTIVSGSIAPPVVEGVCGSENGTTVLAEPSGLGACATGTIGEMFQGQNELQTENYYTWNCHGSGGGSSQSCSATMGASINGDCGTANGDTIIIPPSESEMCSAGYSGGSLLKTINGWSWSCYGFNNGSTVSCGATDSGAGTLPVNPTEDCDSYSGIEKIVCNLGNTIQGMFLPSQSKLDELQTTINKIGNVFPFNYLRTIGTVFSNSTVNSGGLTMTLLGNTASLDSSFFAIPLFAGVKLFFTIMVLLMFTFWAINYIKHFFK